MHSNKDAKNIFVHEILNRWILAWISTKNHETFRTLFNRYVNYTKMYICYEHAKYLFQKQQKQMQIECNWTFATRCNYIFVTIIDSTIRIYYRSQISGERTTQIHSPLVRSVVLALFCPCFLTLPLSLYPSLFFSLSVIIQYLHCFSSSF